MRWCRKSLPLTKDFHGRRFAVKIDGRLMFTPLLLVLIVIDVMDLVFAVDSIPAVFAITTDQFIVYTSNICAILGLRSLYFLLAKLVDRFVYLTDRPRRRSWFRWSQNDRGGLFPHPKLDFARGDRRSARDYN